MAHDSKPPSEVQVICRRNYRLVSNLTDQEGSTNIPCYRSLELFPPEKVQAVLGRRVFDTASEPETVDYAHRTMAEFLAAEYIASRVREGLPFGRITALMGVDGHPATELRGLHAWLTVHLPEHAGDLIETDPYGVLTYGDAASMSPSSCAALVRALDRLSQTNPWFRAGNWQARSIGALARSDLVCEFRAILNDSGSGFGIRSVVIDALALGTPLPAMVPDLQTVLARQVSPYAERMRTLQALLRLGNPGMAAIRAVFHSQLGQSENDLRLRAAVVQALYGEPYGPDDVITVVQASFSTHVTISSGMLWSLAGALPERDLPAILDGIEPPETDEAGSQLRTGEAASFYASILARAWSNLDPFEPYRVMGWLRKRVALKCALGERSGELHAAMRATPERLRALANDFFDRVPMDEHRWLQFHRFREATLFATDPEDLVAITVDAFDAAEIGSDRRLFLYELALSLSLQAVSPYGAAAFEYLFERPECEVALQSARDTSVVTKLPEDFFAGKFELVAQNQNNRAQQLIEFDQNIEQIRSGTNLGWLKHLAFIYFALYSDTDRSLSPRDRIAAWLGEERVDSALEALSATLSRNDLPGFDEVITLTASHQCYDWWYALIAGLNERWAAGEGLADLPDDFLKGALVFDITNPISLEEGNRSHWVIHPWRKALIERQPELVREAYFTIAQLRLSHNERLVDGLPELLNDHALEPFRPAVVLELLRQFPNADPEWLGKLLDAAVALPEVHQDCLELTSMVFSSAVAVDERQRDLWHVTAYAIAPASFEIDLQQRAILRPDIVFDLRDRIGFARHSQPNHSLPLPMLEFMARLTGSLFPARPPPIGGSWGDTNAWNASEHFHALINMISTSPSQEATSTLLRLVDDPELASYQNHLLSALDNQRKRRRESEYRRPDWPQTVMALANRAPATVADLHALLVAHLRDLAHRIGRANTDIFKQFWNLDAYSRPIKPRPEEACRDDVITLLRPALLPIGVMVEPEGHMVADKRADISAAMPGNKILCELKRDYHAEVWTAIGGQLERFYVHDPEAKGFGIYLVFWFGAKRPTQISKAPNNVQPPTTAADMESLLQSLLSSEMRKRLAVIVIDVSGEV